MKLASWLIVPMVNGAGVFYEVSCKVRQMWQMQHLEKGITGSCPKGSEIMLDPTGETTIINEDVMSEFLGKWDTANPDGLNALYGCK